MNKNILLRVMFAISGISMIVFAVLVLISNYIIFTGVDKTKRFGLETWLILMTCLLLSALLFGMSIFGAKKILHTKNIITRIAMGMVTILCAGLIFINLSRIFLWMVVLILFCAFVIDNYFLRKRLKEPDFHFSLIFSRKKLNDLKIILWLAPGIAGLFILGFTVFLGLFMRAGLGGTNGGDPLTPAAWLILYACLTVGVVLLAISFRKVKK